MPILSPERPLVEIDYLNLGVLMTESLSLNPIEKIIAETGARFCFIEDRERALQAAKNGKYSPFQGINTKLERRLFAARAARTSGDFNHLLEAIKGGTALPFDHFTKKMDLSDKGPEIT